MSKDESIRPWGHYDILLDSNECKVKKIVVKSGQRLSYQYHHKREEHWTIVKGEAVVTLNGNDILVKAGEHIHIPLNAKHRIANKTDEDVIFIEVQYGSYFGEDDIIRVEDDYERS